MQIAYQTDAHVRTPPKRSTFHSCKSSKVLLIKYDGTQRKQSDKDNVLCRIAYQ